MTILETSRQFTPFELYKLTKDPLVGKLSDHPNEQLQISGFCFFEDADKKTGELKNMLTFELTEGDAIATNSATVQQSFKDIIAIFNGAGTDNPFPFTVEAFFTESKTSRRPYLNIRLIDN